MKENANIRTEKPGMNTVVVGLELEVSRQTHVFQYIYVDVEVNRYVCTYILLNVE